MNQRVTLHLRDLGGPLIDAWRREFAGVPAASIGEGDIFSTKDGLVSERDPIDIRADAIVSPANSFGHMNGGIDAVYTYQLGPQVQERLRAPLAARHGSELPIGAAVISRLSRARSPKLRTTKPSCSARDY